MRSRWQTHHPLIQLKPSPLFKFDIEIFIKSGKTGYWGILYIHLLAEYPFLHLFMLTSQ